MKIPFNEKELEVVATVPGFGGSTVEILNYPINNFELLKHNFVDKNPQWITSGSEAGFFCPGCRRSGKKCRRFRRNTPGI